MREVNGLHGGRGGERKGGGEWPLPSIPPPHLWYTDDHMVSTLTPNRVASVHMCTASPLF